MRFNGAVGMPAAKRYGLLAVIGLSAPIALAFETGIRRLMMPPEFSDVRAWLSPDVTPWAWAMAPAAVVGTALGFGLQRWLIARARKTPPPRGVTAEEARDRLEFDALMLSTSAPQVPAVLATLMFMVGAKLTPVLITMAVATGGVISLGLTVGRPPSAE